MIFAGQGDGAAIVEAGGLGISAHYSSEATANAMIQIMADPTVAGTQSRESRVQWVLDNASLAASGRVAAAAVEAARQRSS